MYDLVIIGSGPAGMAAAIYAQRACLNTLVLERTGFGGGQVLNTYEVDNYPGLPGISGFELAQKMSEHATKLHAVTTEDDVAEITAEGAHYIVKGENNTYETKGIIIATGAKHAHLNVPGEEELAGMGVSYCATCDGAFFKGLRVAVVGGGDTAFEDALYLADLATEVHIIHRRDSFRAQQYLVDKAKKKTNIFFETCKVPLEIRGGFDLESILLRDVNTGEEKELAVEGVFVAVGQQPDTAFLQGKVLLDAAGYIVAGEDTLTDIAGVYAAGDARTKTLRQVVTAAADGAVAATAAYHSL